MLRDKKILVTGSHGFLGKHLVKNILDKVPGENLFLPSIKDLDLRKWEDCQRAVKGQDIVIHLAALTGNVEFHRLNPGRIFYDNLIMGVQLMEAARLEGVEKFIVVGSAAEYPKAIAAPFKERALWSGYPEKTEASYGLAKKMLLVQGQAYGEQYNFNAIHLLLTNVYGPGMSQNSYVIPSLIQRVAEVKKNNEKIFEVWGTGKPRRDFLYVDDAAKGILLAVEKYNQPEAINLGSGKEVSIRELATTICQLMNFRGKIHWNTSRPDGQLRRVLDISRAKKELGFSPKTSLKEGLLKTIEWYYEKQ